MRGKFLIQVEDFHSPRLSQRDPFDNAVWQLIPLWRGVRGVFIVLKAPGFPARTQRAQR